MKQNERVRNYALITYHNEETIQNTMQYLTSNGRVRHWAYIPHDKDKNEDGSEKEKHIHLLLQLNNSMSNTAVRALFPQGANTLAQAMYDKADCFNYLTHKDKPDKYQYPETDIKADNITYWQNLQKGEADDKTMNIIDDLIEGLPMRLLVSRYGRDFVVNYRNYEAMASMIRKQELEAPPPNATFDENGELIFIQSYNYDTGKIEIF